MLTINQKAPDFNLKDKDGVSHSLKEFQGKKIILYFYPKDNTSGCTAQALSFKELNEQFNKHNCVVIGISKDSILSHEKFIAKYDLPFLLLSDEDLKTIQAYEAWGEKSLYGKKYFGTIRTTYIINEEGIIISAQEKVNPKENPSCSLKFIEQAK